MHISAGRGNMYDKIENPVMIKYQTRNIKVFDKGYPDLFSGDRNSFSLKTEVKA